MTAPSSAAPSANLLPNVSEKTFPFCSDRCRLLDLNNWMEGNYNVSRPVDPTDELEDLPRTRPSQPPKSGDSGE